MVDDDSYCQRSEVEALPLDRRSGFHAHSHTHHWQALECRSYFGGGLARDPGDFAPIVHSWHERVHSRGVEYTHRGMREGPRLVK
jgi:hypothetical protein